MISLKNTLKAITSKISDINSRLSSLSWYYDYSNPTTLSDNFSSWTATADGMICLQVQSTSSYGAGRLYVNGNQVDMFQTNNAYYYSMLKAFVKKGDVVTTKRDVTGIRLYNAKFYPLKFGGGV